MWPVTRAGKIDLLVPTEDTTGAGKLTVGKLYGGVLIYEIWKTTRFSNLEILAKMEEEMEEKEALARGETLPPKDKEKEKEEEKKEGTVETEQVTVEENSEKKDSTAASCENLKMTRENSYDR